MRWRPLGPRAEALAQSGQSLAWGGGAGSRRRLLLMKKGKTCSVTRYTGLLERLEPKTVACF